MDRPLNIKGPDVVWDQLTPREIAYRAARAEEHAKRRAARLVEAVRRTPRNSGFGRRLAKQAAQLEG